MNQGCVKVLLLGESEGGCSNLRQFLERRGCECWFASSIEDSLAPYSRYAFQLILSTKPLHGCISLLALLGETDCSVFYSYPLEDGCWWVPLVRHGQKCLGAPALHANEFARELDDMLREIKLKDVVTT